MLLATIFVMVMIIPFASATDFDNAGTYDPSKETIEVKNIFNLGHTIAEVKSLTPSNQVNLGDLEVCEGGYSEGYGYDCRVLEFEIDLYDDSYNQALGEMWSYDMKNDMKEHEGRELYYKFGIDSYEMVDDYDFQCEYGEPLVNGTKPVVCGYVNNGTKQVTVTEWTTATKDLAKGKTKVGIYAKKVRSGEHTDIVPKWFGVTMKEFEDFNAYDRYAWALATTNGQSLLATGGNHWGAQPVAFNISALQPPFVLKGVSLELCENSDGNGVDFEVHILDGTGDPSGKVPLASNTSVSGTSVPGCQSYAWLNVTIPGDLSVTDNITIMVNGTHQATNYYRWRLSSSGYPFWSWLYSGTWAEATSVIGGFQVFGEAPASTLYTYLQSPSDHLNTTTASNYFSCNATSNGVNLGNLTMYWWNSTGNVVNSDFKNVSGTYNSTNVSYSLPYDDTFTWNCFAEDEGSTINDWGDANRTITLDTTAPTLRILSPIGSVYPNEQGNVSVGFYVADAFLDSCWYSIDEGDTNTTIADCDNFTLSYVEMANNTFNIWANDSQQLESANSSSFYAWPTVAICNSTINQPFINFTFKDEIDLSVINGTIASSVIDYWITGEDSDVFARHYTFSNTTHNPEYSFCESPDYAEIGANITLQYASDEDVTYPPRDYQKLNYDYTNITTNITLYLLSSNEGQYVNFQVVNTALVPIFGVEATATTSIGGTSQIIGTGFTDASGGITFWMDPTSSHSLTFQKTGYTTVATTITPSQTAYTITMGTIGGANITDYTQGLNYTIQPYPYYLDNQTDYVFNFTMNTGTANLSSFGYTLVNASGSTLASNFSSSSSGTISSILNTGLNNTITMNYYYAVDGVNTTAARTWTILVTGDTSHSILNFLTDLKSYVAVGIFGLDEFGLNVLVFLFIFLSVGAVSYSFSITSPLAIVAMIWAETAFFDIGAGLIQGYPGANIHFATIFVGLICVGLIIQEITRQY